MMKRNSSSNKVDMFCFTSLVHTDNYACFSQVDKFILASLDYPGINSAFDTTICYEVDMFCFTSLGHTDNYACFSQVDKFILASLDYPGINIAFDTTICYELDMFLFMAAVI